MRIKAYKSFVWLTDAETTHDVLVAVVSLAPLERLMFRFLQWQSEGGLVKEESSPIPIMASDQSPARLACKELLQLMLHGKFLPDGDANLTEFVEGHLAAT